ncbi:cardiolipin synthetase [Salipiger sp. IMCC34102]|nr:cardiolipin synthetase [Salipiger sp. IMCC34102]
MLQQRRSPQSTAAWLLALIVLPYVAVPIFVMVGFRKRPGSDNAITFRDIDAVEPVCTLDRVLRSYDLPPAAAGHTFDLQVTPGQARAALHALIDGAEERIDTVFYHVGRDDEGRAFIEALTRRAGEGVEVRLLMDRLGSLITPVRTLRQFRKAGGKIEYFSPFVKRPQRGHLNLRNHRKMLIVDDARVFAGGRNVADVYLSGSDDAWVDLSFTLTGPAVRSFTDVFESDWSGAGGRTRDHDQPPVYTGTCTAQLVASGPDLPHDGFHDALLNAFHRATDRIWISTPYFLPTDGQSEALAIAARRGVDVRLILPRTSNQKTADFARGAYLRELEAAGGRILLFEDRMMHAKMGVIDGAGYVGSTNFDVRSMLLNFEDALVVHDEDSVACLSDWFIARSKACTEGIGEYSTLRRIAEGFFRIGAPML